MPPRTVKRAKRSEETATPAHSAAIAAASDGSILINLVLELPASLQSKLADALGGAAVFVGVALSELAAHQVVDRLDDAAAEAAARLLGTRREKPPKSAPRKRATSVSRGGSRR